MQDYSIEGMLIERQSPLPSTPPFTSNCFPGLHRKEPGAVLCLAGAEYSGDKLNSKTMLQLGLLWHNETTILLSSVRRAVLVFQHCLCIKVAVICH